MDVTRQEWIRRLPKAELHLHIEGTLEPEMLFALAARNQVELPYSSVAEVRAAYEFADLQSFLDIYFQGAQVLQTERDFSDLLTAYLERAAADGVKRAEISFDPQTHTERGIEWPTFMEGFLRAIDDGQRDLSISADLILCFLRHLGGDAATTTWEAAAAYHDRLLGVGLDSSEMGNPPEWFADVFTLAREAGVHAVAHAGEEGPPSYVIGALDSLGAERIDHGVRSEEDEAVVERLVADGVPLMMCPLSNVKLRVFDRVEHHNLKRLMDRGVRVTINSDDPAYFGGYIGDNYIAAADGLGLTDEELVRLARTSLEVTFLPEEEKRGLLTMLDAYVAG